MKTNIEIYLFSKKYKVSKNLTVLAAMESVGIKFAENCGCKAGLCGACLIIVRKKDNSINYCLACQTMVEEGMHVAKPQKDIFFKNIPNLDKVSLNEEIIKELFPEIYSCVSCNICTNNCVKGLNVMGFVKETQKAYFKNCSELLFECVMCNACSYNCPANISHANIAFFIRKNLSEPPKSLLAKIQDIDNYEKSNLKSIIKEKSEDELIEIYNKRNV